MYKYIITIILLMLPYMARPDATRCDIALKQKEIANARLEYNPLYQAYKGHSKAALEEYFNDWANHSVPVSKKQLKKYPAAIFHAYKIFEDFYQPENLERVGDPEWGVDQFSHVKYFILQHKLDVVVTKKAIERDFLGSIEKNILHIEIKDFKPRIKSQQKAVFLEENRKSTLDNFLGNQEVPVGCKNIMSPSKAIGESRKRQEFINQLVKIYHGHWDGWILTTGPRITMINFNQSYTKAVVYFQLVYQGGRAIYEYEDGKWTLQESKLTWIT